MAGKKPANAPVADGFLSWLDTQPDNVQELFEELRVRLTTAKTMAELSARIDDQFKTSVVTLPDQAQRALRDTFSLIRDEVKHKVKMDALLGHIVVITDPPDFPPASPDFPDSVFCVIKGKIEDTDEPFECVSGATRVVRHFQNSNASAFPQRLEFYRESEAAMQARNAKPGTTAMWLVRKVGTDRPRGDGIPF